MATPGSPFLRRATELGNVPARGEIRHGDLTPQTSDLDILAEPLESGSNLG